MEKDIGKIKKNDTTDIVVRIDDFGGKPGLTIREYTTSEKYTGFTKSGTRIPADSLRTFKDIINSIDEKDMASTSAPAAPKQEQKPESAEQKQEKQKKKPKEVKQEDLF